MSNLSQFIGGSSDAGFYQQLAFLLSGRILAPISGIYLITGIGGGGGGGGGSNRRGGGAGAIFQIKKYLKAGDPIQFTVGAGGAGGRSADGGNGGNTSVNVSGTTYRALGGNGGTLGGVSQGGLVEGVDADTVMSAIGGAAANSPYSGGGAVGVYGTGVASASMAGAGVGGPGDNNSTGGSAIANTNMNMSLGRILLPTGRGGYGSQQKAEPGGGGSADVAGLGSGYEGGLFAGGGGCQGGGGGGGGGFIGGGGGAVSAGGAGGAGGAGAVIVEYYIK